MLFLLFCSFIIGFRFTLVVTFVLFYVSCFLGFCFYVFFFAFCFVVFVLCFSLLLLLSGYLLVRIQLFIFSTEINVL